MAQSKQPESDSPVPKFELITVTGKLENAEDGTVLVHATNCIGIWGAGVAKQLKLWYPGAYEHYHLHCEKVRDKKSLAGTCLLIPPQKADYMKTKPEFGDSKKGKDGPEEDKNVKQSRRWIACLFTSVGIGRGNPKRNIPPKDKKEVIIKQTREALVDFRKQLEAFNQPDSVQDTKSQPNADNDGDSERPAKILSFQFNSGLFGIPWENTCRIIEDVFKGFERPFFVYERGTGNEESGTRHDIPDNPLSSAGRYDGSQNKRQLTNSGHKQDIGDKKRKKDTENLGEEQ